MIKVSILIAIIFLTISCASKPEPDFMSVGLNLADRAVDYTLEGDNIMSDYTYSRAITHFRNMGRFCDMSRVSLLMYIINPYDSNNAKLDDASAFALLGACKTELNIVNLLTEKPYDYSLLKEPYKSFAKFKEKGEISYLKRIANSKEYSDRVRSSFYRLIANTILDENPADALKFINKTLVIDSKHSWTVNILENEKIILKAYKNLGYQTDIIEERVKILTNTLIEKNR